MGPLGPALITTATKLRLGFAVVTVLYAALTGSFVTAFPWAVAVVGLEFAATTAQAATFTRWGWSVYHLALATAAVTSGVAFMVVGPAVAPIAFVPVHHAGVRQGIPGFLSATGLSALAAALTITLTSTHYYAEGGPLAVAFWLAAMLAVGALGAYSARAAATEDTADGWHEAKYLLRRLGTLAESGTTGFDAPSVASQFLEDLGVTVRHDRSAVLVREPGGPLRPLSLRGVRRVETLPLGMTDYPDDLFERGVRVVDYTDAERGRRTSLIIPLGDAEPRHALGVVLDRAAARPFEPRHVRRAVAIGEVAGPRLEVALLFETLRSMAVLEERHHLAHEMHDGIAQDLAALGFEIDIVRNGKVGSDPDLAEQLMPIRQRVTAIIGDLRLRITDLSMAPRPERSLGAVIAQSLQRFGAAHALRTRLDMDEDQIRLSPHAENAFFRIVLAVLRDAREGGAEQAAVGLTVRGGHGHLDVSHDGTSALLADDRPLREAVRHSIPVVVEPHEGWGVRVAADAGPRASHDGVVSRSEEMRP